MQLSFGRYIAATLALVASPLPVLAAETMLKAVIQVPNAAPAGFFYDGSFVDVSRRLYYLGDRSAKGIDIVDIASNKVIAQISGIFVGRIFNRDKLNNNVSGPNALEMVGTNELWAGDGDSTIKVIDLNTRTLIATIPTGVKARTDFVVHDPDHHIVLATNKNDSPPFISFVNTVTRKVVAKLEIQAKSLDGVVYDRIRNVIWYRSAPRPRIRTAKSTPSAGRARLELAGSDRRSSASRDL